MSNTQIDEASGLKTSGSERNFSTGAKRDGGKEMKGDFYLMPYAALLEVAKVFERGKIRYSRSNWRLGIPLSEYANSAIRHSLKAANGWNDEQHAAMAAWNWLCFMETKDMIERGLLPQELNDIDNWLTKEGVEKAFAGIKADNEKRFSK